LASVPGTPRGDRSTQRTHRSSSRRSPARLSKSRSLARESALGGGVRSGPREGAGCLESSRNRRMPADGESQRSLEVTVASVPPSASPSRYLHGRRGGAEPSHHSSRRPSGVRGFSAQLPRKYQRHHGLLSRSSHRSTPLGARPSDRPSRSSPTGSTSPAPRLPVGSQRAP